MKKGKPLNVNKMKMGNVSSDSGEVKSFLIILAVIIVVVGIIYGVTELFNGKKDKVEIGREVTEGAINYDKIIVGNILDMKLYNSYYVLVYNSEDSAAVKYSALFSKYKQNSTKDGYVKIFFCDLSNAVYNKPYYDKFGDGKSNPGAKTIDDLNFGDLTLLRIDKGRITKYIEDYEEIKKLLAK